MSVAVWSGDGATIGVTAVANNVNGGVRNGR